MKRALEAVLFILAVEAIHFIILTGVLCAIGFFTRLDGKTAVTFKQLLWDGGVTFWFDGFGPAVLLCLSVVAVWSAWEFFADRDALEERRKNLDKEVREAGQRLAAAMRPELEAAAKQACEKTFAARESALVKAEGELARRYREQADEQRALDAGWAEFRVQSAKIQAWKDELEAVRRKAEIAAERRDQIKRRIRWAGEALAGEPPNVGLALRHLKKAEKI